MNTTKDENHGAVAGQFDCRVRRRSSVRVFARSFVDTAAILMGYSAAYALAGSSVLAGMGGAAAVSFYGLWCFYDGSA